MGWWPFGRKRRKTAQPTHNIEAKYISAPCTAQTVSPISYTPQTVASIQDQTAAVSANPFSDSHQSSNFTPSRSVQRETYTDHPLPPPSTPKQNRRSASAEIIRSSPIRQNIERSPHLRPVPELGPGRSSSLRSFKSPSESNLFRSLSSKRRKEDRIREVQLRTPNPPTPVPQRVSEEGEELPPSNSERYRIDRFTNHQNRESTISLGPTDPSVVSAMASVADHTFNVSGFDVLSPHPTIRHSFQTHRLNTATSSRPDTAITYSKRPLRESKTVDDLADNFNAGTLRQLMERDQRRKERKRKLEEDQARKKLQQHADRIRMTTTVKNENVVGSVDHQAPAEAGPSTPFRRRRSKESEMVTRSAPVRTAYFAQNPFADPETARTSIQLQQPTPGIDITMPSDNSVGSMAQTIRYSQASMSPPASPRYHARNNYSLSGIPDLRVRPSQEMSEVNKGNPEFSTRRSGPLAAMFRRSVSGVMGADERKNSAGTFSNTSRESMSRQLPPSHLRERPATPKTPVNAPLRTRSRFIEDLPELPLSPPDSRMQSPALPEQGDVVPVPILPSLLPVRNQLESSPLDRSESRTDSYDSAAPTTGATLLTESLASVDSEASWLSGKPSRLPKQKSSGLLSAAKRPAVATTGSPQEIGAEIERFRRLSIPPRNPARNRVSAIRAGLAMNDDESDLTGPLQTEQDEHVTHGEVNRMNTIIHQGSRVKSTEGLLKQWGNEEPVTPPREYERFEDEDSPGFPETPYLGSAHARHLSAGSARLLDIPARQDSQRSSMASYASPTPERPLSQNV